MRKKALLALAISLNSYAYEPPFTGYHWYNEPKEDEVTQQPIQAPPPSNTPDYSKMNATELRKKMYEYTMLALDEATLHPSAENAEKFLQWKEFWVDHASQFAESTVVAQLNNPDLDYNLKFSHYNNSVPLRKAKEQQVEEQTIAQLSQRYGLFYFFKGGDSMDVALAQTVADFSKKHNVPMIPVAIDGVIPPSVPDAKPDTGQANNMGVKDFPALFLVNAAEEKYYPLAYGFISQDDIAKRYVELSTGFKPNN